MTFEFTGDPEADAFSLCRVAHGLLGQHDTDPYAVPPMTAARRIDCALQDHHPAVRGVAEAVERSWRTVAVGEGFDPVHWAIMRVRWSKGLQRVRGKYVTSRQRRLAHTLWHAFRFLPKDHDGLAFASCRHLASHLDADFKTIAALLHKLEDAGHLTRYPQKSTCWADRFLVQMSYSGEEQDKRPASATLSQGSTRT